MAVIATPRATASALAAKSAEIPIVFGIGTDPVKAELVAAFNQPVAMSPASSPCTRSLGEAVRALARAGPGAARFAVLVNPHNPVAAENSIKDAQSAASVIGQPIEVVTASTPRDIDTAFASLGQKGIDALVVENDPLFLTRRVQLATLTARIWCPRSTPFASMPKLVADELRSQ